MNEIKYLRFRMLLLVMERFFKVGFWKWVSWLMGDHLTQFEEYFSSFFCQIFHDFLSGAHYLTLKHHQKFGKKWRKVFFKGWYIGVFCVTKRADFRDPTHHYSYYDHAYFALGNSLLFHFPGMEDIYCMISKYSDNIKISRAQRT